MQPKDKLQQYIEQGIYGAPELKKEERKQYLGQFRERVIKVLTQEQLQDSRYVDGMIQALQDPRAHSLYVRTQENNGESQTLSLLTSEAQKSQIPFSFVDGNTYIGDIAVVLAAKDAIEEKNIYIDPSTLPLEFYQNQGKTLCKTCYQEIQKKYPEYQHAFTEAGFWKKLFGFQCPITSRHQ